MQACHVLQKCIPLLHNKPPQFFSQVHCQGLTQVPWTQPGYGRQSSQNWPCHPYWHLKRECMDGIISKEHRSTSQTSEQLASFDLNKKVSSWTARPRPSPPKSIHFKSNCLLHPTEPEDTRIFVSWNRILDNRIRLPFKNMLSCFTAFPSPSSQKKVSNILQQF